MHPNESKVITSVPAVVAFPVNDEETQDKDRHGHATHAEVLLDMVDMISPKSVRPGLGQTVEVFHDPQHLSTRA